VEARKQQIDKYAQQQLQTKKNEEYRALAHEIEHCRGEIARLEDQQLELMEQGEQAQRELNAAQQEANAAKKLADGQLAELAKAEADLQKQLAELESERAQLAGAVEDLALNRYERLLRSKGGRVVVGVDNGICGGCHMKFPVQIMVACRTAHELVTCPNCGRILYYTSEMNMPAPA
jgi:predicted  nucleic acid-binding Zn-ribbon protein